VSPPDGAYLSPGWIDLQVNGFAGADYNNPKCTLEEIARSIRVLFSTGVTRFYPTVITGSSEDMLGALHNLKCAKDTLREGAAMDGFHVEVPTFHRTTDRAARIHAAGYARRISTNSAAGRMPPAIRCAS
jgi:N-acetylglucosamine-6-phosphate deacetylase